MYEKFRKCLTLFAIINYLSKKKIVFVKPDMNVLESPRMFLLPVSSSSIFFSDILYESIKIYDFVLYSLENTIIPTMCRNVTLPYIVKINKKYIIYDNKRVIHTTMSLSFGNISSLIFLIPGVFRIFSINYIKTYLLNI